MNLPRHRTFQEENLKRNLVEHKRPLKLQLRLPNFYKLILFLHEEKYRFENQELQIHRHINLPNSVQETKQRIRNIILIKLFVQNLRNLVV